MPRPEDSLGGSSRHRPAGGPGLIRNRIAPSRQGETRPGAPAEEIATLAEAIPAGPENPLADVLERFVASLLSGDYNACLTIAKEQTATKTQQEQFYLSVIQPTMYRIGHYWESGEISVAQEHLCASMVGRLMAVIYDPPAKRARTPKAVVTCAWNEFHELGAWIVADMLAMNGWDVSYLGANTPNDELLKLLGQVRPQLLAISVSMPYNLDRVKDLMDAVHDREEFSGMHSMVGGNAFNWMPELWKHLGVDGYAASPIEGIEATRHLLAS
jgi:MerR family transcriptional regulator, light-induced transcriptional regulator